MAETVEQIIERTIKVYLEAEGAQDVSAGIKAVKKEIDALRKSAKDSGKKIEDLNAEMLSSAKKYVKESKKVAKAQTEEQKRVAKTTKKYSVLNKVIGSISKSMMTLSTGGGGFLGAVTQAVSYEKSLLKLSATMNGMGVSITTVEGQMNRIARSMSLTRKATIAAMQAFAVDFKFPSIDNFESAISRIRNMVGPDENAINSYLGTLSGLSNKYAGLAIDIAQLGEAPPAGAKEALLERVRNLRKVGDISRAQSVTLQAIINGNEQISKKNKEAAEAAKTHAAAVEKLRRHVEVVSIKLGQLLLPFVEKFADWLEKVTDGGEKWQRITVLTVAALTGLKLTKWLTFSKMLPKMVVNMKALSASTGALGLAGKVAGAALIGWTIGKGIYKGLEILGEKVPAIGKFYEEAGNKAAKFYNKIFEGDSGVNKENEKKLAALKKTAKYQDRQRAIAIKDDKEREKALAEYRKKHDIPLKPLIEEKGGGKPPAPAAADFDDTENIESFGQFIKTVGAVRQQQFQTLSSIVEQMKISGNIDMGELGTARSRALQTIDAEAAAAKTHMAALRGIKQLRDDGVISGKTSVKEASRLLGLTDEQVKNLEEQNYKDIDHLADTSKILTNEQIIADVSKKKLDLSEKLASVYDNHIRQTGLLADEAGLLVQLADSYAMGVGASAQMRMREYDAISKNIDNLTKKQQDYIKELNDTSGTEQKMALEIKIQEIENQKTQEMIKQAGLTKSLRDGWIEAIGSMNTGAGTFSKIVMDQNAGTAQSLKLAGQAAIISSRSGNLAGGYLTSEKFSTMKGVAGQGLITGAMGKRNQAYQTTMDRWTGTSAEGLQWKSRGQMQGRIAAMNLQATRGGLQGTAFGASKHYERVLGENGAVASPASPVISGATSTINVNVNLKGNSEQVGKDIAKQIVPQIRTIFNTIVYETLDGIQQ